MKFSEALLVGSRKVSPVRRQRIVYEGSVPVGACTLGFAELGAGVFRCEDVWRWLNRDSAEFGIQPLCAGSDNRVGQQIMRYFDTHPGDTLPRILAWVEQIESRLPHEQLDMCVPGDREMIGFPIPEPTAETLAELEPIIASAEEVFTDGQKIRR